MKRLFLLTILTSFIAVQGICQTPNPNDIHPCGTQEGRSAWLKHYQANKADYAPLLAQKNGGTLFMPLSIQIVGRDDSTGTAPITSVLSSFCQLNADFAGSGIQFFIQEPIHYIYDSDFHVHDSVHLGGIQMLQNNIDSTINVYFVGSPAGNCGYNVPYAGIAMNNGCLGGHTFAHEMGHNLGLPHTFLGWEGGTSWNGTAIQSFNGPAPEQVTINYTDFKDTLYLDTLIIDTVLVEYVARTGPNANCQHAADGFCDTPSDYLAYRWTCNTGGISSVTQYDPDTVSFVSEGEYIMSYSDDNCQVIFSQEQIIAMQAYILTNRLDMLYNSNPMRDTVLAANTNLIAPANNDFAVSNQSPYFEWNASPGATHYILEVYKEPYAASQVIERLILTDTFYQSIETFLPRPSIFPYGWRVYPFNYGYSCAGYTAANVFNTILPAGTDLADKEEPIYWNLYPNGVNAGTRIQMDVALESATDAQWRIMSLTGQVLWSHQQHLEQGVNSLGINLPSDWAAGIYFVEMRSKDGYRAVKKLIIK